MRPQRAAGDLESCRGAREAEQETGTGGAPVRKSGARREREREEGAEVRGEAEGEVGLEAAELRLGESRAEWDGCGEKVGEDILGEGAEREDAEAAGRGGSRVSSGGACREAAKAGGVGRAEGAHSTVDVHHDTFEGS